MSEPTTTDVITRARELRRHNPYLPMSRAARMARYELTAPTMSDGDAWEVDGWRLRVRVTPDDEVGVADDTLRFTNDHDAETIPNPSYKVDSRRPGYDYRYVASTCYTLAETRAWFTRHGASRTVARDLAERQLRADAQRATWDYGASYYTVTVTASRAGHALGSASLGRIDFGDNYADKLRYTDEVAQDLADEAIEDAEQARRAICGS